MIFCNWRCTLYRNVNVLQWCVGDAIVKADNAPDCGVAQGVIHGVLVHHGEKQEEEEGEVEQEVEGTRKKRTIKHQCACPWMGWK